MAQASTDTEGIESASACPSCGRFVGPYATCPYCGARIKGRLSLQAVKIAALLLATVGLAALWWAARATTIPTVTVAEAQGTMNMAYVQVEGRVSGSVTYDPESDYLAFWVEDRTGEVRVSCYRDVTRALIAEGRVPALGDAVTVAGTLRIREDMVALTLNVPEHLTVQRPEPLAVEIGRLTTLDEGRRVRIAGQVRRSYSPYAGLTLITVRDASGEIVVAVEEVVTLLTGPLPALVEGQPVEVVGAVTLYQDTPQIAVASSADVTAAAVEVAATVEPSPTPASTATPRTTPETTTTAATEAPSPTPTPTATPQPTATPIPTPALRTLGSLTGDDAGGWVRVQGRLVTFEGFSGGVKGILDDGTGQVTLLLWMSAYTGLPNPTALDVGAELVAEGEVQLYEGQLEIVPEIAADVRVVAAAPEPPWVQVNQLSAADVGRVVRLRGVLGEPQGFSAGVKAPLDDGTGSIAVLLWSNVAEALAPQPQAGLMIEVVGAVQVYRDELEIIPRTPVDWRAQ